MKRAKVIMKSRLTGANKMVTRTSTLYAGIVDWTATELKDLDRTTRKIFNKSKGFDPRSMPKI